MPTEVQSKDLLAEYDHTASPEAATPPTPESGTPPPASGSLPPKGADGRFLPKRLVAQAESLGLSADEIAECDAASLGVLINSQLIAQLSERRQAPIPVETPTPPVAPERPTEEPDPVIDWGKDGEKALTEEDYPTPVRGLAKLVLEQGKTIKALKSQLGMVTNHLQGQAQATFAQKIDTKFSAHPEIFGEGTAESIDRNSPEYFRRATLIQAMQKIEKGSFDQKFDSAFTTAFGFAAKTETPPVDRSAIDRPSIAPQSLVPEVNGKDRISEEQWKQGTLGPTTSRNGSPEPKGVALAKKTFEKKARELEASLPTEDTTNFEF